MSNLPLVTVITISHNNVADIERTLLSVLSQRYPRMSYVVWDGSSQDGTLDIIKRYADRITYWVSEPSQGTFDAMNKAAKKAVELANTAEQWLFFLYAGDCFADDDVLMKAFSQDNLNYAQLLMFGGGVDRIKADGSVAVTEPAKPVNVIPKEPAFTISSGFVRADVCQFDLDYPLAADYALMYDLYYRHGVGSIASLGFPIVNSPEETHEARLLNRRVIMGEYLGIRSQHISWAWVKEYFRWRFLG